MAFRNRFGHRYPDGQRPNDLIRDAEYEDMNPIDGRADHHWQPHDPVHDNHRFSDGDWWNLLLVLLLSLFVGGMFWGLRGVGLVLILAVAATILLLEETGTWILALLTIVITIVVVVLYVHVMWQTL